MYPLNEIPSVRAQVELNVGCTQRSAKKGGFIILVTVKKLVVQIG